MNNKTIPFLNLKSFILYPILLLLTATQLYAQGEAEMYGWGFPNFTTPSFSWDVYRHSYFGIPADSVGACVSDPFACLFYSEIFKTKLPDPGGTGNGAGNCYGLSVLSLMMNKFGGYLGFCVPLISHGRDTVMGGSPVNGRLTRAINIMHGHQLALAVVESYIEQAISGHSQNSSYAYNLANEALAKEGPYIVCVTKDWNPLTGGHTIIGYKITGNAGNFKIWVVDPNRIWADTSATQRGWYTSNLNFIQCNPPNWTFDMAGSGAWPTGNGHLIILPVSITGGTGRSPASLGLGVPQLITKIFLWGKDNGIGTKLVQMTDGAGRRFFKPGERGNIDWDTTGIRNTVPWLVTGTDPIAAPTFEGYYHLGAMQNGNIEFETGTHGGSLVVGESGGYVKVDCSDTNARATLHVTGLREATATVSIGGASKPMTVDLELMYPVELGRTNRFYTLKNVQIPAGIDNAVTLSIDPLRGIIVSGESTGTTLLGYRQTSTVAAKNIERPLVAVRPIDGVEVDPTTLAVEAETGKGRQ